MTCPPDCSLHLGLVACAGWSHGAWGMELLLGSIRRTSMAAPCRVFVGGEHLQAAACGTVYPPPNFSVHAEKKRKMNKLVFA